MKSKFSEIVSKYLFSYGSVAVPGIGTFSISDSSSGFKLEGDVLTPPTRMIDFSEHIGEEDDGLVKYLKTNHGYGRKDAEKKISDYSKKFLNDLLNYGVANIPGIGQLSKYANGEIVFDPAKEYLITSNYMLPELTLTPLGSSPKVVETKPTPAPKSIISAPAAAAAAIPTAATTAAFLGKPEKTVPVQPATTPPVAKPTPVVQKAEPITPPKKYQLPTEVKKPVPVKPIQKEVKPLVKKEPVTKPIAKTPPPVYYDDEPGFFGEYKWILLTILGLIGLSILGVKCFGKYFGGEGNVVTEKIAEAKSAITGKDTKADFDLDKYLADKPKLEKYKKYLTQEVIETGCIVIVGTYNRPRNVLRIKDEIVKKGLEPYTETHNGMTRVGVRFPCADHDLVDYIKGLRKSFDRGAWYLSPRMDVPRT